MDGNEVLIRLERLHAMVRADSPELRAAIDWLVARGAPGPSIREETVTYPGGSYVDVQVHFPGTPDVNPKYTSAAYLLVHNPSVALIELRQHGLAPGSVNNWEPYIPTGFVTGDQPPEYPPVGAAIPGKPGYFYTVTGDQTQLGTESQDPRGRFIKVEIQALLWMIPAWQQV